jgi:predicted porin
MTRSAAPRILATLAGCVAALSASAQNMPSIYGLLDVAAGRFQNPGAARQWREENGGLSTSFIGIRGSDDLGGGLRARFALETYIGVDSGTAGRSLTDPFWGRSAYVGLQGAFGTSVLGRSPTPLWQSTRLFNPFGDSARFSPSIRQYFTGFAPAIIGDSRWSNSVAFSSPEPEGGNGLSYGVQFNAGEGQPGATGRNVGANAIYVSGPLSASGAWQRVRNGSGGFPAGFALQSTYQLGASYQFAPVKLYGQAGFVRTQALNDIHASLYQLGAAVPIGLGFAMGSFGHERAKSAGIESITRTFSVGYDYFLSKNTDLYAVWMNERVTALSSANSVAAGLRLRF